MKPFLLLLLLFSFLSLTSSLFAKQSGQKEVDFLAFETNFKLELRPIENELFLAPGISRESISSTGNSYSKFQTGRCFYAGHVNQDPKSNAYIDLCDHGRMVNDFSSNQSGF